MSVRHKTKKQNKMKKLFGTIKKTTEKAILVDFEDGVKCYANVWLPKSQVGINLDPNASENGLGNCCISLPTWLLKKQKPTTVDRSNANSNWCSIFAKQDKNGLTENGYAL